MPTVNAPKRTVVSLVTTRPVNFFNISSDRLSKSMKGLNLRWDGERMVVTHEDYPKEEKWILPGGIAVIGWEVEQ
jgi:hypothetical protein